MKRVLYRMAWGMLVGWRVIQGHRMARDGECGVEVDALSAARSASMSVGSAANAWFSASPSERRRALAAALDAAVAYLEEPGAPVLTEAVVCALRVWRAASESERLTALEAVLGELADELEPSVSLEALAETLGVMRAVEVEL